MEAGTQRARAITPEQQAEIEKKLDGVREALEGLRFVVEEVQGLLTPCYGVKGGEHCYLPDRHRGPHLSDAGTEWVDDD